MEKLALQRIASFFRGLSAGVVWQRIWSKDWVLKFISLLLAAGLWYFVGGEDTVDKNVMIPIEVINMPRDLVISNQFKKEIEVTVSGPRTLIQEMITRDVTRQIDLSDATPGANVIENSIDSIPVPRGVTVLRIQPQSIILSLDKLIQKHFPITPVTTGDVATGYALKSLKMEPDTITITGPQTILSQVDELRTKIIDINSINESKQLQVPLDLEAEIVDLIGETSVTAEITVALKTVRKFFAEVEVLVTVDGLGREVTPAKVDLTANIPLLLISKDVELRELFTVTAIPGDDGKTMNVKVIPRDDLLVPIEIVSIVPRTVILVAAPEAEPGETRPEVELPEPAEKKGQDTTLPDAVEMEPEDTKKEEVKAAVPVQIAIEPRVDLINREKTKIIKKN